MEEAGRACCVEQVAAFVLMVCSLAVRNGEQETVRWVLDPLVQSLLHYLRWTKKGY